MKPPLILHGGSSRTTSPRTCTVLVLYAVYLILFLFSLYTIIRRDSSGRRIMLLTSAAMFLLATSGMITSVLLTPIDLALIKTDIRDDVVGAEHLLRVYSIVNAASDVRLVTNNLVADLLFTYRCYMIWGSRKTVLILPAISILAAAALGYFTVASNDFSSNDLLDEFPVFDIRVSFAVSGATNIVLMCLAAGRIWYISRRARSISQNALHSRYRSTIAMILESGALYSAVLALQIFALSLTSQSDGVQAFRGVSQGLVEQMVNVIPTLIFVRVGMGYCQWREQPTPVDVKVRIPAVRAPLPRLLREEVRGDADPDFDFEVAEIKSQQI
ncbi:hypothetical protein MSAN_02425500 [Mycena sanguinolenta]|uniref:Uncharacterized protein n=1 Tax=Mycena sanguinolenta TaxID=230812 RepID=A0A8H6X3D5_9AGAR|nr:hypothetical protein MSAN_02425500 [Mycena sanguinolenta]